MLTIKLTELLEKQYGAPVKIHSLKLINVGEHYVDFEVEVSVSGESPSRTYVQVVI